jgi:hypothetical protein
MRIAKTIILTGEERITLMQWRCGISNAQASAWGVFETDL